MLQKINGNFDKINGRIDKLENLVSKEPEPKLQDNEKIKQSKAKLALKCKL